ncbi:PREDICTED: uncharacterized protein LOC105567600 [Vollenhovia emeryi]|uniref:uncharacterized protein LOC105562150 n=1 Tax=Vollenhovia emeryi TaxID=411798 RepID=UPI0005F50057|nr:PREDICTED: uncharacterized protein LOC105562150 [Vollenhovia emeryi]XP_011878007.1 PREDICTED: uncharacterized protein LOC105567600 [Vollenhovia emeryi]
MDQLHDLMVLTDALNTTVTEFTENVETLSGMVREIYKDLERLETTMPKFVTLEVHIRVHDTMFATLKQIFTFIKEMNMPLKDYVRRLSDVRGDMNETRVKKAKPSGSV